MIVKQKRKLTMEEIKTLFEYDYKFFDKLPKDVRVAISNTTSPPNTQEVYKIFMKHGSKTAINAIKEYDESMRAQERALYL